jgi:hypothetical protein
MHFENPITEAQMLAFLDEGQLTFPPLEVMELRLPPNGAPPGTAFQLDALLTVSWHNRTYRFGVATKRLWTPKSISDAMEEARENAGVAGINPLILVPYLSEEWLQTLEDQDVSGIDFCGNGVVLVPDELLVLRTGFPNRFRWEGTIKNVYRKTSSVVARAFLLVPQFNSVKGALEEIRKRGGETTTATISKVSKSMEADLVIERARGDSPVARRLRLLQPEKLLDFLAANYVPPEVNRTFRGRCELQPEALRERLAKMAASIGERVVLTGASSVEAYAKMAQEPMQSFYCTDIDKIVTNMDGDIQETDHFANVTFQETRDDFVYFDRRAGLVSSPIQAYLELVKGDNREKETADQVRRVILGQTARVSTT